MSQSNSEFSRALGLNLASLRFGTLRRVLEDDLTIEPDGPASIALDAGGVDRTVRLPPFLEGGGAVCFLSNIGTAGNLSVTSANGLDVATLEPGSSSFFIATEVEWIAHKTFQGLHVFGSAGANHSLGLVPDPGTNSPGDLFLRNDGQWGQVQVTGIVDAFKFVTDGTNTAVGAGPDTLRLRSDNGSVIATVTNNDPTYGDTVNFDVYEPNIDHNQLGNYVADEHVAHSLVDVVAGTGLSGGGNIASSVTINFDPHSLAAFAPVLTDEVSLSDATTVFKCTLADINAILVHDNLVGFVANEHVDHSLVAVQAGTGLSGGGDLTTTRTLSLNISGLSVDSIAVGDFIAFYDISGADHNKITFSSFNSALDHNSLLNVSANKHIDHTTVSINAGTGLSGGGDISTSRTLAVVYGTTAGTAAQGDDARITGAVQSSQVGVGANKIVQFDASGKYPAADGSQLTGLSSAAGRNTIINGDFRINQRVYVSGATLAAGSYGHDRWKAGAAGGDYSFVQLPNSTQITIAAGKTLQQVVEDKNVVGGSYALSWTGTAQGRIGINGAAPAGAYAASPITVAGVNAGQQVTIEFNNGTLGLVQFELGTAPSAFERRNFAAEMELCQRYFWKTFLLGTAPAQAAGFTGCIQYPATRSGANFNRSPYISFPVQMRAVPTITFYNPLNANGQVNDSNIPADCSSTGIQRASEGGFNLVCLAVASTTAGDALEVHATANAEL